MQADAYEPGLGRAQRLRVGLDAVRAGAGEGAFLLGCGCPLGAAVGVVDGMRIGTDVAPRWRAEPGIRIPGIEETLPSTRSAVRSVLARAWMHRRLWLNDPDCLMARRRDTELSLEEARTLAIAIAATGGMLVFSDDWGSLDAAGRDLVRDTLAAARAVDGLGLPSLARAPALLAGGVASTVFAADAEGGTLALFNPGDAAATRELDPGALGFSPPALAPEPLLGSPAPRAESAGKLRVSLAPHASALFRMRRAFPLAIFCDFDGTFSVQDVGATLAKIHAGDRRPAVSARYERGEITAWQYNLEILDRLPLSEAGLEAFLRTIDLDPGAAALVAWCRERRLPFRVLSDGFDYNLNRLQALHGVRFAFEANHLRYEDGRWRIVGSASQSELRLRNGDLQAWTHRGLPQRSPGSHAGAHRQRPRLRSVWRARRGRCVREGFARERVDGTRRPVPTLRDAARRDPPPRAPARRGRQLTWNDPTAGSS